MNILSTMKLHETIYSTCDENISITKVPGGWIYKFLELNQIIQADGTWSENYIPTVVFVPSAPFDVNE